MKNLSDVWDIRAKAEEGQRELARWKAEQAEQKTGNPDKGSEESRDVTECGGIPAFYGLQVYRLCASASASPHRVKAFPSHAARSK